MTSESDTSGSQQRGYGNDPILGDLSDEEIRRLWREGKLAVVSKPERSFHLQRELDAFDEHRAELVAQARGKYALVYQDQVAGIFDSPGDAIGEGYRRFGYVPLLVKEITEVDVPVPFPWADRVLDGDYIMQPSAVEHYGRQVMEAMERKRRQAGDGT